VTAPALRFDAGVTLVGGGAADRDAFEAARALAPRVVAADGGANRLRTWDCGADAVVGDMDSIEDPVHWRARAQMLPLAEQDTTDLEKCLYSVAAPFFVGVGFTGLRLDHTLAALHVLLKRRDRPLVLLGERDVAFACPDDWSATLAPGARVSFFPLGPVRGVDCAGLRWPVTGLDFAPGAQIGTSNLAETKEVRARFSGPGMIAMLERRWLRAALASLGVGT
jgi:thiamine pyrophosphokinase